MRILIVSDAWQPQINGVVRTYENLKHHLKQAGHDVNIIGPRDFPIRFGMPGYKEIELAIFAAKKLQAMVNTYAPDIIHIGTEGPLGWAARKYCLKNGIEFTTMYHSQFPDYVSKRVGKIMPPLKQKFYNLTRDWIKKFHGPASALIVSTDSIADQLTSWGITPPLHKMTLGLDTALFHPAPSDLLNHLPRPIALYVGRLAIEKNIEAFLSMPWEGSKVVVGHGPDQKALQQKFPTTYFMGKKTSTELVNHYRASDVLVFPSRTDTFGMVIIEALACGIPVAAYPVNGPKDILIKESLGVMHEDLSLAATQALTKGSKEQRHAHVAEHYSWDKAASDFLAAHKVTTNKDNKEAA